MEPPTSDALTLTGGGDPNRPLLYADGLAVTAAEFERRSCAVAAALPAASAIINLCERRDYFLLTLAAALLRGQPSLLPPARARQAIEEVREAHPGSATFDDTQVAAVLAGPSMPASAPLRVAAPDVALIGYTSGSTGRPQANPKRWAGLAAVTHLNAAVIRQHLRGWHGAQPTIVATVPPQHMYGVETSVLLPLLGGMAVHAGRPLFPADIAAALALVPAPRILVSTPVHLRALVDSQTAMPPLALILSATAPLDATLAGRVEAALGGVLLEMFGSTETCVIATRRTSCGEDWQPYDGVRLSPGSDSTVVHAPWFAVPARLQDLIELLPEGRFRVLGRNTDLVEVAGKRASLGDLTRRLLAIPGVRDAAVWQQDAAVAGSVRRIVALAVAPGRTAAEIGAELSLAVDPVFLPRPLVLVASLPRDSVGKLPRDALQAMLVAAGRQRP